MKRIISVLCVAATMSVGPRALAQHATGADIEDGGRAYETSCAACHGPDGNLIAGIDFSRGQFRRPLADEEIVAIIRNGIANTPMPPMPGMSEAQALQIVAYLRSLPETLTATAATGDAARGREIALGSGECLDCHRIEGRGSRLGPSLARVGAQRRATELERALLDPNAEVQPAHRFIEVTPRSGAPVAGRLLNQDTFAVQLLDEEERLRLFDKNELRGVAFLDSPMPSYRDRLDAQALADVVAYLVTLRGDTP